MAGASLLHARKGDLAVLAGRVVVTNNMLSPTKERGKRRGNKGRKPEIALGKEEILSPRSRAPTGGRGRTFFRVLCRARQLPTHGVDFRTGNQEVVVFLMMPFFSSSLILWQTEMKATQKRGANLESFARKENLMGLATDALFQAEAERPR